MTAPTLWLQVSAGQGPAECARAAYLTLDRLLDEARTAGLSATVIESVPGPERDTLASALVSLDGTGAADFADRWQGTVQWTCPSPYRPRHRRKNWFVGVAVLAPPGASGGLDPRDVTFQAQRGSGPGGQHVNTTDSAVRATHGPSGLTVLAREERSQHRNRALALARLAALLDARTAGDRAAADRAAWTAHHALARGGAGRRFTGPGFVEITPGPA